MSCGDAGAMGRQLAYWHKEQGAGLFHSQKNQGFVGAVPTVPAQAIEGMIL